MFDSVYISCMKPLVLIALFFALFLNIVSAQQRNEKQIEQDLLKSFKKIYDCKVAITNHRGEDIIVGLYDTLTKANDSFKQKLISYTAKYPSTIKDPFNSLTKEGMFIVTSFDYRFRIYSWDTETGGTAHDFNNVVQFKDGNKTYVTSLEPGYFYTKATVLKAAGGPYYLVVYNGIESTKDMVEGIQVLGLKNSKVDSIPLIKTATGLHNELSYEYDYFSLNAKVKDADIHYNPMAKTITLPVVLDKGRVTNNRITYKFNGQYFERVKS